MKRAFKVEKLPLDTLINLLINLYETGIDYVDLSADNTDPLQDKLVIQTKDEYINHEYSEDNLRGEFEPLSEQDDDDDDLPQTKQPPIIETKRLTDEDINDLL